MNLRFAIGQIRREMRGARGRIVFIAFAIGLGVAAVTGVGTLTSAFDTGLRARSAELLGADLAVSSRRALPDISSSLPPGTTRSDVRELPTIVRAATGPSRLVELKVPDGPFPLRGALTLDPAGTLEDFLDATSCVVAPALARELGLSIGDPLFIGGEPFAVRSFVIDEPSRLDFSLAFGPRVFVSATGLERTSLIGFGSRVKYQALLAFDLEEERAGLAEETKSAIESDLGDAASYVQIETPRDAQPGLRRAFEQIDRFLGLVALLSLLVGAIGVSQVTRAWMESRVPSIAIERALGFRPRDIAWLSLAQVFLIALGSSVLGGIVGSLAPALLPILAPNLIPAELLRFGSLDAAFRGVLVGTVVGTAFCLPPLISTWRVSPARVLRSNAAPLKPPFLLSLSSFVLVAGALVAAAYLEARSWNVALAFSGIVVATGFLLSGSARVLLWTAGRMPRTSLPPLLVNGVSALARPGSGTASGIVALGLGVLVVLSIAIVERTLGDELAAVLPADRPSVYLWDIQPGQWSGVSELLEREGAAGIDSVPVAMARLSRVRGEEIPALIEQRKQSVDRAERGRVEWIFTREQRVTWLDELPDSNTLTAGELWSDPDNPHEMSIEEGFAGTLGVGVGDTLTLDVQGAPMTFTVTSLRSVNWRSFDVNFFLVAEPGALDAAPHFRLGAINVTSDLEQKIQDQLSAEFPNVTMLRVREILDRVRVLIEQIALATQLLGLFAVLTGIGILAGQIAATQWRRGREAALWKVLGLTRGRVAMLFGIEYALIGLVAGTLGAVGAYLLAIGFVELIELDAVPAIGPAIIGVAVTAGLSIVAGLAASARALRARPIQSLRG